MGKSGSSGSGKKARLAEWKKNKTTQSKRKGMLKVGGGSLAAS